MSRVRGIAREEMEGWDRPVSAIRHRAQKRGLRRGPVAHSHAALAFYTGGASHMEGLSGEWSLGAGDVLLVPAGMPHRVLTNERPEYWTVTFAIPPATADDDALLFAPLERVRDGAAAVVQLPFARHGFVDDLLRGELETCGGGDGASVAPAARDVSSW